MQFSVLRILSLFATAAVVASVLTITIPSTALLPNPNALPAGTHATLTSLPSSAQTQSDGLPRRPLTAPLTRSATFVFRHLPVSKPESFLLDIRSPEYVFAPYRVDVAADGTVLGIWETFRGNPWDNRGHEKFVVDITSSGDSGRSSNVIVEAKILTRKGFYEQRAKFSPLSLFKNPMILLALVALAFTFGMPKLMENMDPEMRAEFEAQSRSSPLSGATRGAISGGGSPADFDLAGWMAGTSRSGTGAGGSTTHGATTGREGGGATRRRG